MQISENGLKILKNLEGLRLKAYQDVAGIWTIGYGHAGATPEQEITEEEANRILGQDVERFEQVVAREVKVPLTQNQFDALVIFVFNIGAEAFRRSTLLRKLNAGDYNGAADEFKRWVYSGGKKVKGLVRRRQIEAKLFRSETT